MSISIEDLYRQKLEIDGFSFQSAECHERLKIARGYYATFLSAKSLLESDEKLVLLQCPPNKDLKEDRYGSHQKIAWSLIYSRISGLAEVGQKLMTYHELRKKADYDIHLNITADDIRDAEDFIKFCQERIDYYLKHGNSHFTSATKVINATKTSEGIKINSSRGIKKLS